MNKTYFVYILTNWQNLLLYVGITNDLTRRLTEHKEELIDGFTKKYHIHKLVYYEETTDVFAAIEREKQIKTWSRKKKADLVESVNPYWLDLSEHLY